eukprot:CAMPEP_0194780150 /NCGR_PEP_ID=MMETSP0323_2-20130528/72890_1 /TAXON_ID=2866 ORGANISM="Crypthecodinium cohnii, Strain Seligo" /NCGR_SAMPLE_ID=MMETSP0323_2 /ASSEMBLY_ACC=CAM_ASM_000346 /LENGTH=69 /DNA_ID=CAMNT_0039718047 /DNA_START=684 /DNA_END=890 /DNA_ORIENTATION=-
MGGLASVARYQVFVAIDRATHLLALVKEGPWIALPSPAAIAIAQAHAPASAASTVGKDMAPMPPMAEVY